MFGRVAFPPIGDLPYLLTLAPHTFYWFSMEAQRTAELAENVGGPSPRLSVKGSWEMLFQDEAKERLQRLLPNYLRGRRWFGGKARQMRSTLIPEVVRFPFSSSVAYLTAVSVSYLEGGPETYLLLLTLASGARAAQVQGETPQAVVAHVHSDAGEGLLYEAVWEPSFCQALLDVITRRRRFKGALGKLVGVPTRALRQLRGAPDMALTPSVLGAEQSNTSIIFGDKLI
jgi:maltose alpha-D-glucosyltransferase/alpha-amylase